MRTAWLILYVSVWLASCRSADHIPDNVLPQKKMQAILWDMMRADQFLADYVLSRDSTKNRKTESIKLYKQVFAIHHVSKEEFQRSFSFYKSHPALLKVIMDSLSRSPSLAPTEIARPDTTQPGNKVVPLNDTLKPAKKVKIVPLKY